MDDSLRRLTSCLRRGGPALLLFSGGLDSSLLLAVAARVLGPGLAALTLVGPHIVPGELAGAWALARRFRVRHLVRPIDPLELEEFRENPPSRCYVCKKAVIQAGWQVAAGLGARALWDGTNVDDLSDFRPGLKAAEELGVASPLLAAGLDKAAIRRLSRELGLPIRPPQSCLATRFPYHTPLTREALARVGQAEAWLRRRGFGWVRLRVRPDGARLELAPEEWQGFLASGVRGPFAALVAGLGLGTLTLDLPG